MVLGSAFVLAAEWGGSYFVTRSLDKIFSDKNDFIRELSATINLTITEYDKKYHETDKNGKFSFYKSQMVINELLKYRIMPDEGIDLQNLKEVLTQEENIIPPRVEQIEYFYDIFMKNINNNPKLKKLEIKESFQDEIFNISKVIREINDKIDNLVSTYNGDLQAQWSNRLSNYIATLKEFKPQTAFDLLDKLEKSFEGIKNKPNDALLALIKYQKGVCLQLLEDKKFNITFIDAYKKDKSNIKYKEKAAFAVEKQYIL